jgi:hypothetical protein
MKTLQDITSPPLEFERATGLTGIHTPWVMPHNLPHSVVEYDFCALTSLDQKVSIFDQILTLNPGLKTFLPMRSSEKGLDDVVLGTTSQFNLDDIKFFVPAHQLTKKNEVAGDYEDYMEVRAKKSALENDRDDRAHIQLNKNSRLSSLVSLRANTGLGWRASEATLKRIWKQMDTHPRYASVAVDFNKANDLMLRSFPFMVYGDGAIADNYTSIHLAQNEQRRTRGEPEVSWTKHTDTAPPVHPSERALTYNSGTTPKL